jgi:hypothetical protein
MTRRISRRLALRSLATLTAGSSTLPLLAAQRLPLAFAAGQPEAAALQLRGPIDAHAAQLATALAARAPGLNPQALLLASQALQAARQQAELGALTPRVLAVIDYSLPSTEKRLWVFDLRQRRLLHEEWVAHGRNSGNLMTERFSNVMDSRMSSLGAFVAGATYQGSNGYSLRLRGLEPGFNDLAYDRAIVMHGAPYVSEDNIRRHGRLGRSWGCPAMRPAVAAQVIDCMAEGGFLFGYYPEPSWLAHSQLIGGLAQRLG